VRSPNRVAVVLPGGGARGAYEIGALSVLLPALEERGERVSIWSGTSVGAINAALLGSLSDLPPKRQVAVASARWRTLSKGDVMAPIVGPKLPLTMLRLIGGLLDVPGLRLASLLDASPLRSSLNGWVEWEALHRNVARGAVDAVCVVATSLSRGRPVAFVQSRGRLPRSRPGDALRYVRTQLRGEHVRASAAIPVLFPPVEVTAPRAAAGEYIDGGTRLNTPIKPALALGADRVIVIAFEPPGRRNGPGPPVRTTHLSDVAANILDGLLVDQVVDDLHRLAAINAFFVEDAGGGPSPAARHYRTARGRPPYRKVAYAIVAPSRRGELAALAEQVFERRFGGLRGLLHPDYPFLSRALGGPGPARGELLSFLLFEAAFVEALLECGKRDARRWLDRHPAFWCSDAAHDLAVDAPDPTVLRESGALEEWRALRRR
jgi:NTE family protein